VQEAEVLKDYHGDIGDRRQELVFIGLNIKEAPLSTALDACLCEVDDQVLLLSYTNSPCIFLAFRFGDLQHVLQLV